MTAEVLPGHLAERRLRIGFVGCGDHAFRNVYPVLRYLPVDLVAVCDRERDRAEAYRRAFGAEQACTDVAQLEGLGLDAVLVVTSYDADGRTTHPEVAARFLEAGVSAWVEKPPVNDLADIALLRKAVQATGATFGVGFKKAFTPANRRARSLVMSEAFGTLGTLALRYAQRIPTPEQLGRRSWAKTSFLDHLGHPTSIVRLLGGPTRAVSHARSRNGTGFLTLHLESGALATIHLTDGIAHGYLAERTEAVGDNAGVVVENGERVLFVPHDQAGAYGRAPDFTTGPGATVWEPEHSLGQLYNKGLFLLGYHAELDHFCEAVAAGRQPEVGGLDWAEEGIRVFDAFRAGPDVLVELASL